MPFLEPAHAMPCQIMQERMPCHAMPVLLTMPCHVMPKPSHAAAMPCTSHAMPKPCRTHASGHSPISHAMPFEAWACIGNMPCHSNSCRHHAMPCLAYQGAMPCDSHAMTGATHAMPSTCHAMPVPAMRQHCLEYINPSTK